MKVLVCLDDDGHFNVACVGDRAKCVKLLLIHLDYFQDTLDDYSYGKDILNDVYYYDDHEWLKFLETFEQQGMCEIVDV